MSVCIKIANDHNDVRADVNENSNISIIPNQFVERVKRVKLLVVLLRREIFILAMQKCIRVYKNTSAGSFCVTGYI